MGRSEVTKGKVFERELARRFTEAEGTHYSRNLTESRGTPRNGVDVEGGRFAIQAKCGARPNVIAAQLEAESGCRPGEIPIAAIHKLSSSNTTDQYVLLTLADFLILVKELNP